MNNETQFKVGDWVFHEFNICQVKSIESGRITEVTDGYVSSSSWSLNDWCFPLDVDAKLISEEFELWYQRIREKRLATNIPDIRRKLVGMWRGVCESRNDPGAVQKGYKELRDWANVILSKCDELERLDVDGVKPFKR